MKRAIPDSDPRRSALSGHPTSEGHGFVKSLEPEFAMVRSGTRAGGWQCAPMAAVTFGIRKTTARLFLDPEHRQY